MNENPTGLRTLVPDCPKALARVVHRALQKDPRLRYQTAAELQGDIESMLAEIRSKAVPPDVAAKDSAVRAWRRRAAVGVPALLLVATAGVLPRFTHRTAERVVATAPSAPVPTPTAAPVAPPTQRIHQRGNFEQAEVLSAPAPSLTTLAQERGVSGVVQLEATVGEDGYVKDVSVVSGDALLTAAAREAALHWTYVPAKINGHPIEAKVPIQMIFQPGP